MGRKAPTGHGAMQAPHAVQRSASKGFGNIAQARTEDDGPAFARLAAHPALDALLRQAGGDDGQRMAPGGLPVVS